jgi:hypothetical protein
MNSGAVDGDDESSSNNHHLLAEQEAREQIRGSCDPIRLPRPILDQILRGINLNDSFRD